GDAGKGDPVVRVRIRAGVRINLLGGAGLAGDLVALDCGRGTGTVLHTVRVALGDRLEHSADGLRRIRRHGARLALDWLRDILPIRVGDGLDQAWLDTDAVVSDRLVDAGHWQQIHAHALSDGKVRKGPARPLGELGHVARGLVRHAHVCGLPHTELPEVLVHLVLTDALGEHQGADVGGLPKYAGGGIRSHAVLPGVADGNTSHFNGARHLQHLVRSGLLLLDSGGGRHDLGDGARLESLCG